jgi:hypothetical protein
VLSMAYETSPHMKQWRCQQQQQQQQQLMHVTPSLGHILLSEKQGLLPRNGCLVFRSVSMCGLHFTLQCCPWGPLL